MASYCIIQPSTIRHNGQLLFEARVGEEQSFFLEAYRYFDINYPKFHKMDRFCQLGFLSALPIVPEKRLAAPSKTGVLLASKSGSIHTDQHYYEKVFAADNIFYSPAQFTYTLPSAILGELCIKHNIQGENYFLLHGMQNLDLLKDYAKQLFHSQQLDACLIGWMDYYTTDHFQSCYLWVEREDLINLDTIIININKFVSIMEKQQLVNEIKNKIIEQLNLVDVDPASVSATDPLFGEGMGLDSIDGLEIVVILERDYNITITEIESLTPHFESLNTLAEFVAAQTAVAA